MRPPARGSEDCCTLWARAGIGPGVTTMSTDRAAAAWDRRKRPTDDGSDPAPDPAAWIRRHQPALYWFLKSLRCPADFIEDCMQEALTRALRRPFVLRMGDRSAAGWLRTTVRNLYFMELRRRRQRPEVSDRGAIERAWEVFHETPLAQSALRDCLDELAPRAQRAIELRYHENAGRAAIADELGLTEHGVKSLLRRVRDRLRSCVEEKIQ